MDPGWKHAPFCSQSERVHTPLPCATTQSISYMQKEKERTHLRSSAVLKQDYAELIHCHTYAKPAAGFGY